MGDGAVLQLHLAPLEPIEINELTGAFSAISRQYGVFARAHEYDTSGIKTRLLISGVSPGSIDINFVPDLAVAAAGLVSPIVTDVKIVSGFAQQIKELLDRFSPKKESPHSETNIKDCDDAINIVKPVAEHGGVQTFNTFTGPVFQTIYEWILLLRAIL
jgi:hypothetical protein